MMIDKWIDLIEGKIKQLENDMNSHHGVVSRLESEAKTARETISVFSGAVQAYKAMVQALKDPTNSSGTSSTENLVKPIEGEIVNG